MRIFCWETEKIKFYKKTRKPRYYYFPLAYVWKWHPDCILGLRPICNPAERTDSLSPLDSPSPVLPSHLPAPKSLSTNQNGMNGYHFLKLQRKLVLQFLLASCRSRFRGHLQYHLCSNFEILKKNPRIALKMIQKISVLLIYFWPELYVWIFIAFSQKLLPSTSV